MYQASYSSIDSLNNCARVNIDGHVVVHSTCMYSGVTVH